jgi:two-component system chemotaxis response regulator CheB
MKAIFIGTSAGGITAVQKLFDQIGNRLTKPVVVVQHVRADAQLELSMVFGKHTKMKVVEARDKMSLDPNHAYFAPPGYHLLIEKDFTFALSQDEPVHFSRPSIDVCFETAADVFGPDACGVLLTGANSDGADGLKRIQEHGGYTMVQDPMEAESSSMPRAAIEIMTPDLVGKLKVLADKLVELETGRSNNVQ